MILNLNSDTEKGLAGILNLTIPGVNGDSLLITLDMKGIAASTGSACAMSLEEPSHVLKAIGRSHTGKDTLEAYKLARTYDLLTSQKDKDLEKHKSALKYIDAHLLNTPTIAVMQVKKEIESMMQLSQTNFAHGINRILHADDRNDETMKEIEETIDFMNNQISEFLIQLTHKVSMEDEKIVGSYFHVINDIERIGDHAYNFYELSLKMVENELAFSADAVNELGEMYNVVMKMFDLSFEIFNDGDKTKLEQLHELEDITDKMKTTLNNKHFERITKNQCKNELSPFYSSLVSELERVADHLVNVGYSIVNPTGDTE